MFTAEQNNSLEAPLSRDHVKTRAQAGRSFSYIEGWQVISEANRIFGFDGWTSETVDLRCVAERERKVGQSNPRDGFGVSYTARVRVTVISGDERIVREGVGAGHGIDVDQGLAHESAIKEAETDGRKRALMTFGNPFGLALYDKAQLNVAEPIDESHAFFVKDCDAKIDAFTEGKALRDWWGSEQQKAARRTIGISKLELDALMLKVKLKLEILEGKKAA